MIVRLLSLLTVLLVATILATGGRAVSTPVLTPAYGPGYDAHAALLIEIRDEVRGLRLDLRQGARPGQDALSLAGVLTTRCASCHQAKAAQEKGAGFVLVEDDGSVSELSLGFKRAVAAKVRKGEMPPPPATLTAAEKQLLESLPSQPSQSRGARK